MEGDEPFSKTTSCPNPCFWRIFPPPTAARKRTKKKPSRRRDENNTHHESSEKDAEPKERESNKDLWRQKQQQYQYTYPYQVGEAIILLTHGDRRQKEESQSSWKRQKISPLGNTGLPPNCNSETVKSVPSNDSNRNFLLPVPGTVASIVGDEIRVSFKNVATSSRILLALTPKEQRKLLRPDLSIPNPLLAQNPIGQSSSRKTAIILVEETLPFRQVVRYQLHKDVVCTDRVLEIGCSTGELSSLIWKNYQHSCQTPMDASPSWIGMDHSQEMIDACAQKLKMHMDSFHTTNYRTKLVKVDALAEPQRAAKEARFEDSLSPTVVLIDIGGNRECGPVLRTISWVLESFGGNRSNSLRLVIVKSRALVRKLLNDDSSEIRSKKSPPVRVNIATGTVTNGPEWFDSVLEETVRVGQRARNGMLRFKHPLKAPMVVSPLDGKTPICRYHNYHRDGCKLYSKRKDSGVHPNSSPEICPFDHDHCHACRQAGHKAKDCPRFTKGY